MMKTKELVDVAVELEQFRDEQYLSWGTIAEEVGVSTSVLARLRKGDATEKTIRLVEEFLDNNEYDNDKYKTCSACSERLPRTEEYFTRNSKGRDGLQSECKTCMVNRVSVYYKENHDKKIIHQTKWRRDNLELHNLITRESRSKARAKEQGVPYNYSVEEWVELKEEFNDSCGYCGIHESDSMFPISQDHIKPTSLGGAHDASNVIPSCLTCNSSKGQKDVFKWFKEQEFYTEERENKIKSIMEGK